MVGLYPAAFERPADRSGAATPGRRRSQLNEILIRTLNSAELGRLGEIDRTELVETIYYQHGATLKESAETFDIPPWSPIGDEFHTVPFQIGFCEKHLARGGQLFGAFDGARLVGIGLVTPHIRLGIAQLSYLHVSNGYRGQGVGKRLVAELERIAVEAGDTEMVVSATPSVNTVRFYMSCGYAPMAEPLPELFEEEPEDVHLNKRLAPS